MMYRARTASVLTGLGMLVLVAACSSAAADEKATSADTTTRGPAQEITVAMGDFYYDPKVVTVQPGRVRFVLSNVGQTAHRFAITGQGLNVSSKNVGAGRESVLEIDLGPGPLQIGFTL